MKRLVRCLLVTVTSVLIVASCVFLIPRDANALSTSDEAYKKAIGTAIRHCYANNEMLSPLTMQEYDFNHDALAYGMTTVAVPNLNGHDNYLECYKLFNNLISWPSGSTETKANFLVNSLGYTKKDGSPEGECIYFTYTYNYSSSTMPDDNPVPTDYICADSINADGTVNVDKLTIRSTDHPHGGSSFNVQWEVGKGSVKADCKVQKPGGVYGPVKFTRGTTKWTDLKNDIEQLLLGSGDCVYYDGHTALLGGYAMSLNPDSRVEEPTGTITSTFEITDTSAAAAVATNALLGTKYDSDPSFTTEDTFTLYQAYVTEYYNADIRCGELTENQKTAYKTAGYYEIAVVSGGEMKTGCFAKATANADKYSSGAEGTFGDPKTFEQICDWLNKNAKSVDVSKIVGSATPTEPGPDGPKPTPTPGDDDTDEDVDPSVEEKCYAQAKSLGWVICPMIFGMREMTENFYRAVEPLIQTNKAIVTQAGSNSSGLYSAWSIFRGFANILFVIFFMFIIFSQLTGFGIDNYGIKRMLPKLIIAAILINLSFWIAAIAIDISNIAGYGIKRMFEGIGNGIFSGFGGSSANAIGVMGNKWVSAIATAGTVSVIAGVSFALEGWAIILPVLLALLVAVIAIFFALIILGMRQALVVILLVLAPLALACTVLPNTEGIFKKWFNAAKGVLMVYPIAGAIIGAGYLTASILMSADDGFIMTVVSGILMVGPYFLIPSLTAKALDAVGNLGSRLSNFGRNTGNRIRGGINNSEAARNARADSREAMADWRANRFLNSRLPFQGRSTERRLRNGETVSTRRARRYARAQERAQGRNKANLAAYDSMLSSRESENKLDRMHAGGLEAREFAQEMNAREAELSDQRLATGDGRAAWRASVENKALEAAIADQSSLMERDGTFGSDERFRREVRTAALGNDDASRAKLEALMRKAANGSDRQRELLREGMNDAFSTGNVSSDQAARYGAHVTGNSIYKKNDRSMHDQATAIMNAVGNGTYGTQGTRADGSQYDHRVQSLANDNFVGQGFVKGKQSAESAFNYDDGEFAALAKRMQSINQELDNSATTDSRRAELENIKENIAKTLGEGIFIKENDPNNKYGNVNKHVIDEMKKVINAGYGNDGWKKFYQSDSAAFKVSHDQPQIVTQNVESEFREMGGSSNLPNPGTPTPRIQTPPSTPRAGRNSGGDSGILDSHDNPIGRA